MGRSNRASTARASTNNSNSLFQSPIFWMLLGLSGILLMATVAMYSMLEDMPQNDDVMVLGSSGGDGLARDQLLAALGGGGRHHNHNGHSNKRNKRGGGGGNGVNPSNMEEAIEEFRAFQAHDKRRRAKRELLTVRETFERDNAYSSLEQDIQKLRQPTPLPPSDTLPYDIHHCPPTPPANYPYSWSAMDVVLQHWNPDDTNIPQSKIHQGLCFFDYEQDKDKVLAYRAAQVPFVIQNVPEVMKAAVRWTTPNYLDDLLGTEAIRNEHSRTNHFMFWKTRNPNPQFEPPTDMIDLTYAQWLTRARALEQATVDNDKKDQTTQEHWYFRLNAMLEKHGYVYEELPFFDPTKGASLTMIHPNEHRGINCRFGMKGVIAESHYDSSSNFIAVMGGQRRYILAHPDQCEHMELYPQGHPSGRHSSINWSTAAQEFRENIHNSSSNKSNHNRPFAKAKVNEVVLQAGDVLYLPTYWFHFIVSLNINYQCNARSGESFEYEKYMAKCGFPGPPRNKSAREARQ